MASMYDRVVNVLNKMPPDRRKEELIIIETWFRKKSKLFAALKTEVLIDVIKHCQFTTKRRNDVIILQGEKGHNFYIILRGSVSIYLKEDTVEMITIDKHSESLKESEKAKLGTMLGQMGDGRAFGELALLSEDCVRTASVVADEPTDLVIINRDLYSRSMDLVIRQEYEEKFNFVEKNPLFRSWPVRWRKHLAAAITKETFSYDDNMVRQGESAIKMFFLLSGEVRMKAEPELHLTQFHDVIDQSADLMEDTSEMVGQSPLQIKEAKLTALLERDLKQQEAIRKFSPSELRKYTMSARSRVQCQNICIFGPGQIVGDAEFLLDLEKYHTTAVCTQETSAFMLHKAHYDRLFRRRNPHSIKTLLRILELKLIRRAHEGITHKVPLFKCMLLKVHDLLGISYKQKMKDKEDPVVAAEIEAFLSRLRANSAKQIKTKDEKGNRQTGYVEPPFFVRLRAQAFQQNAEYRGLTPGGRGAPVVIDRRPKPGILLTLMHITDPEEAKRTLEIEEDEVQYLINLKKRVAREFEEFDPFANLELLVAEQKGGRFSRPCGRGGRLNAARARTAFPGGGRRTSTFPGSRGARLPTV